MNLFCRNQDWDRPAGTCYRLERLGPGWPAVHPLRPRGPARRPPGARRAIGATRPGERPAGPAVAIARAASRGPCGGRGREPGGRPAARGCAAPRLACSALAPRDPPPLAQVRGPRRRLFVSAPRRRLRPGRGEGSGRGDGSSAGGRGPGRGAAGAPGARGRSSAGGRGLGRGDRGALWRRRPAVLLSRAVRGLGQSRPSSRSPQAGSAACVSPRASRGQEAGVP